MIPSRLQSMPSRMVAASVGNLIVTVISTSITGWLGLDEAYPFYQSVIYRLGRRFDVALIRVTTFDLPFRKTMRGKQHARGACRAGLFQCRTDQGRNRPDKSGLGRKTADPPGRNHKPSLIGGRLPGLD